MNIRRPLTKPLVALSAAVLTLSLAACGGESTPSATSSSPAPTPAASVAADEKLFAQLPDEVQQSKTVQVGTEALYPPYEYLDTDGTTVVGMDVDLLKATTQRLGISYKLTNTAFDGLLPGLDSGRYQLIWAAITDTKARQAKFSFVDYFQAGQAIVVPAGNPKAIKVAGDLCGKNVSVLVSSAQEAILTKLNKTDCASSKISVISLPSDTDALLQVQSKRADASFTQEPVGRYNVSKVGGGKAFEVANSETLYPNPLGVAFAKKDVELRDAFQASLQSLIADGTYTKILQARGLETGAVTKAALNGGTE